MLSAPCLERLPISSLSKSAPMQSVLEGSALASPSRMAQTEEILSIRGLVTNASFIPTVVGASQMYRYRSKSKISSGEMFSFSAT